MNDNDDSCADLLGKTCKTLEEGEAEAQVDKKGLQEKRVSSQEEPIDGEWGWVVVGGSFIIMVVNQMLAPCFGIMFSGLLTSLQVSSTTVAWIFNFQGVMFNLSLLLAPPLCDVFGFRKVAVLGAVLAATSIIISSLSTSAAFLFFSFSFLSGIGGGFGTAVCYFIIPKYFKKRIGTALALMQGGVCLGQFIGPILISYLQEIYGFFGATLILGGVFLHSVVGAAVFQPVSWHSKRKHDEEFFIRKKAEINKIANGEETASLTLVRPNRTQKNRCVSAFKEVLTKIANKTYDNLKMITSFRALIISIGILVCFVGFFNFLMMVPFELQKKGYSLEQSAWCLSVSVISNFVTRMLVLFASDLKWFNKIFWYIVGSLILSASSLVFTFLEDYTLSVICLSVIRVGIGINVSLNALVMIEIMGRKDYQATFGITGLFMAVGSVTLGPLAGFIRDITNSFEASMQFLSCTMFIGFLLWLMMPLAVTRDKKRADREQQQRTEQP